MKLRIVKLNSFFHNLILTKISVEDKETVSRLGWLSVFDFTLSRSNREKYN